MGIVNELTGMGMDGNVGTKNIDERLFYNTTRDIGKVCILLKDNCVPIPRSRTSDTKAKTRFLWLW